MELLFIKSAILDLEAQELLHVERAPMPDFIPGLPAGHLEVDPSRVMGAIEEVSESLLRAAPRCDGVVLCGQMQGFVLVNGAGEPLSNYISWLDRRVSAAEFEAMAGHIPNETRADLANELRPDIALPILWWLKNRNALPPAATPISIADFVAGRLCRTLPGLEPTQAGAFGALSEERSIGARTSLPVSTCTRFTGRTFSAPVRLWGHGVERRVLHRWGGARNVRSPVPCWRKARCQ